jgi:hypothetical protein
VVIRLDRRVATTARRLGGEPVGEETAREPSERGEDDEDERAKRTHRLRAEEGLSPGAKRLEPRELAEEEPLTELEAREEGGPGEPRDHAHRTGVKQRAPEEAQLERRLLREERESSQSRRLRPGGRRGATDEDAPAACKSIESPPHPESSWRASVDDSALAAQRARTDRWLHIKLTAPGARPSP